MHNRRKELIDSVVGADWTWHERSCKRLVDVAEESLGEDSPVDDLPLELNVRVKSSAPRLGEEPTIQVRERSATVYKWLDSKLDVSVTFTMREGFQTDDKALLHEFVSLVGFEYVLGLIRSAFLDSARIMGIEPPIFPAVEFSGSEPN